VERSARPGLLVAGWLGLAAGCIERAPFACDEDEQCRAPGVEGSCVAPGFCAHPDDGCESGLRFGRFAAPELAGECTTPELAGSSSGTPGSSSEGADGSSSTDPSTGDGSSSSSTGEPVPLEECNGIDDDGDGLVDEWSPLNAECSGCTLYQRQGHAYWRCATGRWTDLQPVCASFGANLATVDDAAENLFLALEVESGANWLGLNDIGNEGVFTWVDGSPVGYTNWTGGVPPGDDIDSNCVGVDTQGEWHSFNCTNSRLGFCEAPNPD
jgi:hypothetical protein